MITPEKTASPRKMTRLLMGASSLALIAGWSGAAQARCDDVTPATGQTIICDETDPNPELRRIRGSTVNNVTVRVTNDPNVAGAATIAGIELGENATITTAAGTSVTTSGTGEQHAISIGSGTIDIAGSVSHNGPGQLQTSSNLGVRRAFGIVISATNASLPGSSIIIRETGSVTSTSGSPAISFDDLSRTGIGLGSYSGFRATINGTVRSQGDWFLFNPDPNDNQNLQRGAAVYLFGVNTNLVVGRTGTITSDGRRLSAIWLREGDATADISGTVTARGLDSAAIRVGGDFLIVRRDILVERGLVMLRPTAVILATGDQGVGVELAGEGASLVTEAGSTITSDRYNGVTLLRGGTVTNAGRIESKATAAGTAAIMAVTGNSASSLAGTTPALGATITNSGEIISAGTAISVGSANVDTLTVVNTGRIAAGAGPAIVGGTNVDLVDNTGRIEGVVNLGGGNDRVILRTNGYFSAAIDGGDGADVLQLDIATGNALISERIGGAINGFEVLEKTGFGTLSLSQVYAPRALLIGGIFRTSGDLSAMAVEARAATTLEATGSLGAVTLADGATLSAGGTAVGNITMSSLSLSATSRLRFDLGAPSVVADSDLINVTGNLVLDGLVDVEARPNFGNGVYRLINYSGTLTNNGLLPGSFPLGSYEFQTAVAGQVNLVVSGIASAIPNIQFWDGASTIADGVIGGGAGIWNASATNWTSANGATNEAWASNFAVFQGTGGTVTLDPAGVTATGLQFASNGYRLEGGPLTLNVPATLRVGDGTAAGSAINATIGSAISGTGGIEKTDLGTLILTGASTYSGGTKVAGGTLRVSGGGVINQTGVFAVAPTTGTSATLDVTGAGSALNITGTLLVGAGIGAQQAGDGFVNVTAGGRLASRGALIDNTQAGSAAGIMTVSGTGSTWTNVGEMSLGSSKGGQLAIASGGVVNQTGSTFVANLAGSTAAVSVTGVGSALNVVDTLTSIGQSGAGSLSISAGGAVTNSGAVNLGNSVGASGAAVVSGAGSLWTLGGQLTVGVAGTGSLQVLDGGVVAGATTLGVGGIAAGSMTISGVGSRVSLQRTLNVGLGATGNLTISNGGRLETSLNGLNTPFSFDSRIGDFGAKAVGRALVTGTGSIWTTAGNIQIGNQGADGALRVENGATLVVGNQLDVGRGRNIDITNPTQPIISGKADFVLTGRGTTADINGFAVGNAGSLGTATVADGAVVTSKSILLGVGGTFVGSGADRVTTRSDAELLVTGPGTQWTNAGTVANQGSIAIAANGRGTLRLSDGAQLTTRTIFLSASAGTDTGGAPRVDADDVRTATLVIGGAINRSGIGQAAEAAGTLNVAERISFAAIGDTTSTLVFNHTANDYVFSASLAADTRVVSASQGLIRQIAGTTRLTGLSSGFTGVTRVEGGTLVVGGVLGGTVAVNAGGSLSGTGTVGTTTIIDGGILRGRTGETLTLGSLALSANSLIEASLAAPATTPLFAVTGALRLDGTLNVTATPGFGDGVYRLFTYGGALTDNGLTVSALPSGALGALQTSLIGQVNLVIGVGNQFWDGAGTSADGRVSGGAGTWSNSATNWTNSAGDFNAAWLARTAIFQGTGGTVTIAPDGVSAGSLQFASTGYRLEGGPLSLTAPALLRVGDGTAAATAMSATIASAISGTNGIDKIDLGTLVLTGTNTYAGGTRVSGGVLSVGADSALGAASGNVTLDGGTLRTTAVLTSARSIVLGAAGGTFDLGANAVTLSGALTGAGALNVLSSGVLTVSGNSGSRTGATRIDGGTLALSGTLGGPVTVGLGATLTGTGTTGNLIVEGRVGPGNSPGTLNVNGNLTFAAGSTYGVELGAAGATDAIAVSGTAALNGGTVVITTLDPERNYINGSVYRILSATGGVTGRFAGLTDTSAFLDYALSYGANFADVTVTVVRTFPEVARTFNQINAANGLRDLDKNSASDAFNIYRAILFSDEDPARAAFDSASGEIYAVALASAQSSVTRAVNRFGTRATTGARAGWSTWGGVTGHQGRVDGDGNGATYKDSGTGGELGIDYRGASNAWAIGVGGARLSGDIKLNARASSAKNDGWHVGGFGRYGTGGADFTAIATASYGENDYNVTRAVTIASINRTANAQTSSRESGASIEGRYGFSAGNWAYGPVAMLSSGRASLVGFNETGIDSLNLSSGPNRATNQLYSVGAFVNLQNDKGTFDLSVLYAKRDVNPTQVTVSLAGSPTTFSQRAANQRGDAVIVRTSGDYGLGGGWTLGGHLGGQFSGSDTSLSGSTTLSLKF
jgi:fibronectin-binding autotransporter adhesin